MSSALPISSSVRTDGRSSVSSLTLKPEDQFAPIVALIPATDDAHSLVSSSDTPLIMRRQVGKGIVDQLAFDASISPLRDWEDLRFIFSGFLGGAINVTSGNSQLRESSMAVDAARALPGAALPSFLVIALFLSLYVITIGPVNFYWLRRYNKLAWAWFTIPATVVLFTILGYASGFRLHGNEPQVHRLSVIAGSADVPTARSQAIVGLYSPRRTTLDISTGHHLAQEIQPDPDQPDKVNFLLSDPNRLDQVAAKNSDMRAYFLQGESLLPTVQADLTFAPGHTMSDTSLIQGIIHNASSAAFHDCVIIAGKDYYVIGNLAPGTVTPVEVKLLLGRPQMALSLPADRVQVSGYVSSYGTNAGHGASSSARPTTYRRPFDMDGASLAEIMLNWRTFPDRLKEQAERGLVTALYNNPTTSAGTGVSLACWDDTDRVNALVDGATYTDRGLRIWRLPVHPLLAIPTTVLPPDAFTWYIASSTSGVALDPNGLTMQPGEHIIAMTPWINVRSSGKVNIAMAVTADSDTSSTALRHSSVALFDWDSHKFTEVITSVAVGPPSLPLNGAFLSSSGELRIRVSVRDDDMILTNVQASVAIP